MRPAASTPEEEKRRRRRKALLLLLLLGLLAMLCTMPSGTCSSASRSPRSPPIPESTLPGYSTSVYGATNPIGIAVTPDGDRIYVAGAPRTSASSASSTAAATKIGTASPAARATAPSTCRSTSRSTR